MANHEISLFIGGKDAPLEAQVWTNNESSMVGIMCHPHSLKGGDMGNKVVTTVTRAWQTLGWSTVRFNFRGVGQSLGVFDEGIKEQEDLAAVVAWVKAHFPGQSIAIGGFSFGAFVALAYSQREVPSILLLVAPPIGHFPVAPLKLPNTRVLIVVAGEDEVVSTPEILAWVAGQEVAALLNIPEASHFFHGKLVLLKKFILENT